MGWMSKMLELAKDSGFDPLKDGGEFLIEKVTASVEDEQTDREGFAIRLAAQTRQELEIYVPTVYQKNIYKIDYKKLWDSGIRLLSFDIDDTIDDSVMNKLEGGIPWLEVKMPKKAVAHFEALKSMGFIVTLITNTHSGVAAPVCKQLGADDYICHARKPETTAFEEMCKRHNMDKAQMAHIGNSMRADIVGGNRFGIVTCLVRRNGFSLKVAKDVKKMLGIPTKGHLIRERLLEQDLWRKHHLKEKGDQYYQLGELPLYRR